MILDFIRLWPMLQGCLVRSRGNITMEHSVRQARVRNNCALVCLLAFCLLASRFAGEDFGGGVDALWRTPLIIGGVCAYLILRRIIYKIIMATNPPVRNDTETRLAIHSALYNYFIVAVFAMLTAFGVMSLFSIEDAIKSYVLLGIFALFLLLALLRISQILSANCSGLRMFLYLCALELLPLGALVATALIL